MSNKQVLDDKSPVSIEGNGSPDKVPSANLLLALLVLLQPVLDYAFLELAKTPVKERSAEQNAVIDGLKNATASIKGLHAWKSAAQVDVDKCEGAIKEAFRALNKAVAFRPAAAHPQWKELVAMLKPDQA